MDNIRFTCTSLANTNKVGIITPDTDGYYDMVVGGLNVFNSVGQYYEYEGAKALFESSSPFMRRIKRGALRGEVGHPKQMPGEKDDDYLDRIYVIDERNVCVHFKEIYLDFNSKKMPNGDPVIAIMAKLTPSGPKGDYLAKQIANKSENVCFSIRSLTQDTMVRGRYTRTIKHIVTFDNVNEPGISIANKYEAPGLESLTPLVDKPVTKNQILRSVNKSVATIGTESAMMDANELFTSFGWSNNTGKPAYSKW